jgi:Domain of unknown function (DUF4864)
MRTKLRWIFALMAPLMTAPSLAAEQLPDPALSPAEVIDIQLSALQANDTPARDAGIVQAWAFAHPDNKQVTGPLARFAQMIHGPRYQVLLDHQSHEINEVFRTDDEAAFAVIVTSKTGNVVGFRWAVARVADGEHAGAWMTVAVSPPVPVGKAI